MVLPTAPPPLRGWYLSTTIELPTDSVAYTGGTAVIDVWDDDGFSMEIQDALRCTYDGTGPYTDCTPTTLRLSMSRVDPEPGEITALSDESIIERCPIAGTQYANTEEEPHYLDPDGLPYCKDEFCGN